MAPKLFDVAVIGGGVAGLAAALTLGRARRTVQVIDEGEPRNAPAAQSHGYLTRDGVAPLELVSIGRAEVAKYGVELVTDRADFVQRLPSGAFEIRTAGGLALEARRVLATTGLVDQLATIPGLRERWARDVVHCPFCFGWEIGDMPLGVLAGAVGAAQQALMWRQWSRDIVLFLHKAPPLSAEESEQLAARGIKVVEGEVTAVETAHDRLTGVRLRSGEVIERSHLVVGPRLEGRHGLLHPLGVEVVEHPLGIGSQVRSDAAGQAAPGVWVAGNLADVTYGVLQSAASGVTAAAAINADLTGEDTRRAVESARSA